MNKWHVSEQAIYDENGNQIIEASEWYMREQLQKICDEHNNVQDLICLAESAKDYINSGNKIETGFTIRYIDNVLHNLK
jgi:hypothetical protein